MSNAGRKRLAGSGRRSFAGCWRQGAPDEREATVRLRGATTRLGLLELHAHAGVAREKAVEGCSRTS
jgi:hypothetical protein